MKKLIKIGIITFSLPSIIAMASTSSSSPTSVSTQFELSQSFQTKLKKSFKNSKWVEQTQSNSGNKITNGKYGTLFEDSRGNLWSMAWKTPLQKYNYQTKKWTPQTSGGKDSSNSNITNGYSGTLFEDSRGNLWSMGYGTPLQKYNYQTKKWTTQTSDGEKSNGSNIISGLGGTIFEDSRGNLWSMGWKTPLQKYNYQTKKWTAETSDSSGSNITNGDGGTLFEDSRGNLWSMAFGTPLQKYDYTTKEWITETKERSGNNITNGYSGTIFEDSRGNLWSMGLRAPLQKYNYQAKKWTAQTSGGKKSSGSNIINGNGGTLFEDSRGNLWSMAWKTPLQKYDYTTNRWTTETKESSGNNIIDGLGGTIFEDSRGNLWSMGRGTPLQKYNYQTKRWTVDSSGSNITKGLTGTIFEDSRGNLWSMGWETPLQKLTPIEETNLDDLKVKDFDIEFKTRINQDSKIALLIKGYRKYTSSLFTHLQYKKKTESNWKVVKKRTMILDAAEYEFKWVFGTKEILASEQNFPQKITIRGDGSIGNIIYIRSSDIAKVNAFLTTLSNLEISSLASPNKLVEEVTKAEILAKIKLASGYSSLTPVQQGLVIEDLINKTNDPDGTLKVTILFDGETYEYSKSGFKLSSVDNVEKVETFLKSLNDSSISSLVASTRLVGQVTKSEILDKIKLASGYSSLTSVQQSLITKDLVSRTEDPAGTLKVMITFKGQTYELIKDGFKLTLQAEANKFKDFVSNDTTKSKAATLKASSKDVLNTFEKISGYQRPPNLASDIAITKVIVKNALNPKTQKVTFELAISRNDWVVKKDVVVTFKKITSGLAAGAIVGIVLGSIFGIGIIGFLIFYLVKRNKKGKNKK